VFDFPSVEEEARAFVECQQTRGKIRSHEVFKAMLAAKDATAIAVNKTLEKYGYTIGPCKKGEHVIQCASLLVRCYEKSKEDFITTIEICKDIYKGKAPKQKIFGGIFDAENYARQKLGKTLNSPVYRKRLVEAGHNGIFRAIQDASAYLGKDGPVAKRSGVLRVVNRGLSTNIIADPATKE
jgi:hypothetical protein